MQHISDFSLGGVGKKQPNITAECGKDQEPSGVISHAEATVFISMPSLCGSQTIRNRFGLPLEPLSPSKLCQHVISFSCNRGRYHSKFTEQLFNYVDIPY